MKSVEDSAKEMLEMEVPFRLNSKTWVMESDDPRIFLKSYGMWPPDSGKRFIFHLGDKRFGFRTAEDIKQQKVEELPDGTMLWWFDDILCKLWGTYGRGQLKELTNTYTFSTEAEQELVLSLFIKAMQVWDKRVPLGRRSEPKAGACLTPRAVDLVAAGKFLV
jgi:hypothetical protein